MKEQQAISDHYKRADGLKVKNYDDLEAKAIEILGEDFATTLIANTDDAHLILPYLGANPGKMVKVYGTDTLTLLLVFLAPQTPATVMSVSVSVIPMPEA